MTKTKTRPKGRPFKKFYCDRPNVFLIPAPAFKIWMYHYAREGNERQSWPSIERLSQALGLERKSIIKWRKWLTENRWLIKVGDRHGEDGLFKVPVMRVANGVVPQGSGSGSDGRKKTTSRSTDHDQVPKSGPRPSPQVRTTDRPKVGDMIAAQSTDLEVDSYEQVDSEREVKPQKQVEAPKLPDGFIFQDGKVVKVGA